MRIALISLIALFASRQFSLAVDPPDIQSTSPDQNWSLSATFHDTGQFEGTGYDWKLQNLKTGKIAFHDQIEKDSISPQQIDVKWSPDSHYAAVSLYYGRAMQDVMIFPLAFGTPDRFSPIDDTPKKPLELTLIKPEDLKSYQGYNRLLTSADHWLNNTDLSIEIEALIFLKDKAHKERSLSTTWHRTVRFQGKSFKTIDSVCDSYDIEGVYDAASDPHDSTESTNSPAPSAPQSAAIIDINDDPSATKGFGPTGNVQVYFADGRIDNWTRQRHAMLPRVAESGLVGWASFHARDSQQFPLDDAIRICWPDGHHKDVTLPTDAADHHIGDWKFADHDAVILISAGGLHGSAPNFYRYDLKTGKLLASAHALMDQAALLPEWTHAFDN